MGAREVETMTKQQEKAFRYTIAGIIVGALISIAIGCGGYEKPYEGTALFIVSHEHVRMMESGELDVSGQDLIVCDPSVPAKSLRPHMKDGAMLFAYFNAHMVPTYEAAFFEEMRGYYTPDMWLTDETGNRQETYPRAHELDWGAEAGERVADVAKSMVDPDCEGIYLDELWGEVPKWKLRQISEISNETDDVLHYDWYTHRHHLLVELEDYDGYVIANVGAVPAWGGSFVYLDGITVEASHVKTPIDSALFRQAFSEYEPRLNVAWLWQCHGVANTGTFQ